MNKTVKIQIPVDEAHQWQTLLDANIKVVTASEDDTLAAWSGDFGDGYEADVKVCNGDNGPWVDVVLFDNGVQVATADVSDTLLGETVFDLANGDVFTVNVVAAKLYRLYGDICHAGVVNVYADTLADAVKAAEAGDFEIEDEQNSNLGFDFDGVAQDENGQDVTE